MELNIRITAAEKEALRRALAGLVAEERARFPGRNRQSRVEQACESLYEKIFDRSPHDSQA
jgi:hypothetical protein